MKFVHEVCQTFADRLRELRIEKQLTQEQLGKNLGVSRGSISFYENCDRVPDIVFLVTTANYFGVDIGYLLGTSGGKDGRYGWISVDRHRPRPYVPILVHVPHMNPQTREAVMMSNGKWQIIDTIAPQLVTHWRQMPNYEPENES